MEVPRILIWLAIGIVAAITILMFVKFYIIDQAQGIAGISPKHLF
jgi:hypothetical protein